MVSIITINYNNSHGLLKTIQSVLNQSNKNIEYIIIDGDSNDGSKEIIKKYKHSLHYAVSEKDTGIYDAQNKGIKQATGNYLLFLNSGDILNNDQVIENFLKPSPSADIVYGNLLKVKADDTELDKGPQTSNLTFQTFWNGTINHPSSFIKKDVFNKIGLYDTNYKIVSDWLFFMKAIVLNNATVQYINLTIAQFDMNGLSNSQLELRNFERQKVLNELFPSKILDDYSYWQNQNMSLENLTKIKKFYVLNLLYVLLRITANLLVK